MPKRVRTGLTRTDILHRYMERFRQQLIKLRPFLSRKRADDHRGLRRGGGRVDQPGVRGRLG